jgi:thiol-disulfide isomerase/thioredoxin
MSRSRLRVVGAICALLAVLLAAGWHAWQKNRQPQGQTPEVTIIDLQGHPTPLSSLRGKVVLVNFWATSCAPCLREMPNWIDLDRQLRAQGLRIIAVAMAWDAPNYVLDYTARTALPFTVALDPGGQVAQAFGGVNVVPTSFLLDQQGRIIEHYTGIPDIVKLQQRIRQILAH